MATYLEELERLRNIRRGGTNMSSIPSSAAVQAARSMGIRYAPDMPEPNQPLTREQIAVNRMTQEGAARYSPQMTQEARERGTLTAKQEYDQAIAVLNARDDMAAQRKLEEEKLRSAERVAGLGYLGERRKAQATERAAESSAGASVRSQEISGQAQTDVAKINAKTREKVAKIQGLVEANKSEAEITRELISSRTTASRNAAKEASTLIKSDAEAWGKTLENYTDPASAQILSSLFVSNPEEFAAFKASLIERISSAGDGIDEDDINEITQNLVRESLVLLGS